MKPIYTCGAEANRAVFVGNERVLPPYLKEDPGEMVSEDKLKVYISWGNEEIRQGGKTEVKRIERTSPPEGWSIGPFPDHLSAQKWIESRTHMITPKGEKEFRVWGTSGFIQRPRNYSQRTTSPK